MKTEEIALSRISENEENPRTISTEKFQKLVKSLLVFPRMLTLRPIVVDETFKVLGGNMRLKALRHITTMQEDGIVAKLEEDTRLGEEERNHILGYWKGWQKKPVATIVSAKDLTESQKKEFIIKDNVGFGDWDTDMLANKWNVDMLIDWGMEQWQLIGTGNDSENDDCDDDSTNNYERKIVPPTYEPQDCVVSLSDCYDTAKVERLVSAVNSSEISDDVKAFLKVAAFRHAKFNYEKVADYYAQAPKEVQQLMEDSALVIVDFDKAIEDGFVSISKDFMEQYGKEHGHDAG